MENMTNNSITTESEEILKSHAKRKKLGMTLLALALVVAVGVPMGLRYYGQAMSHKKKTIICEAGMVHEHTNSCYGVDAAGNQVLLCGLADYVVHSHNEFCYDGDELICKLPEIAAHVHDDSCYRIEKVLVCDIPEVTAEPEVIEPEVTEPEIIPEEQPVAEEIIVDSPEVTETETTTEATESAPEVSIPDEVVPQAALPHIHTDACYMEVRTLICGQNALHTHSPACYDAAGNLICGELELKAHTHTADCVTDRELTREELIELGLLNNEEMTLTYQDEKYLVTATYTLLANIPEDAVLLVKEVEEENPDYEVIAADVEELVATDETDTEIKTSLDIGFYVDGVEIEPEAEVEINIQLLGDDIDPDEQVNIVHTNKDGVSEIVETVVTEDEDGSNLTFKSDSFSYYTVTITKGKAKDDPEEGKYGKTTLTYNKTKNAFLTDAFSSFRNANGAVGQVASNFHIVAFDTAYTNVHTNGNILAKNLDGNANFGTNGYTNELSYIQNLIRSGSMQTGGRSNIGLIVGDSNKLSLEDNNNKIRITGTQGSVSTGDSAATFLIKDVDTKNAPFIDLNDVKAEVEQIMSGYAGQSDINTEVNLDRKYIKITDPDSAGYVNIKASDLERIGSDLDLVGFETTDGSGNVANARPGSLIVNLDCQGKSNITIPTRSYVYFDSKFNSDGTLASKGTCAPTGEVTEFAGGKVIWNLYNAPEDSVVNVSQITGIVLAPNSYIKVNMMNGNVVGKNVEINGESHRTDFTGTTVPVAAALTATKTIDGLTPSLDQKFNFTLSEKVGDEWKILQTVQNEGSNIVFKDLSYGKPSDVGKHIYKIAEAEGSDASISYDTTYYMMEVDVTFSDNKYNASTKYTKVSGTDETPVDKDAIEFKNTSSTSVTVEKKWVAEDGVTAMVADLPASINVTLYQTTGDATTGKPYSDTVTLTAPWTYTWDNLPREDENKTPYFYYVVEEDVEGFTQVKGEQIVVVQDGTYVLTNKKKPGETSVTVEKQFFLGDNQITNPCVSIDDASAFVKFRLMVSEDGGNNFRTSKFPVTVKPEVGAEYTTTDNGTFTINKGCGWKLTLEGLPQSGTTEAGQFVNYTYKVIESESTLMAFPYKYDFKTNTVAEGNAPEYKGGFDEDTKTYSFTIINTCGGYDEIDLDKTWLTFSGSPDSIQEGADESVEIKINIYSTKNDGSDKTKLGTYTWKAKSFELTEGTNDFEIEAGQKYWIAKVKNLPKYYINANGDLSQYLYEVEEIPDENGYTYGGYKMTSENLTHSGDVFTYSLTNQSTESYELPHTGGKGNIRDLVVRWIYKLVK